MKKIIAIVTFVFLSTFAQAQFAQEGPSLNRKVRNLGMGNTGIALKGTHGSSPFYNPAGLNDLKDGQLEFFSIAGEISSDSFGLVGDLQDLSDELDAATTDADRVDAFNDFANENAGKFKHVRLSLDVFNYVRKNFAIGLVIDEKLDVAFRNPSANPQFDVRNFGDAALFVSGAHGFWDGLLQTGITLKPTVRFAMDEADQEIELIDALEDANGDIPLVEQFKEIKDRRFGLGVDLGLKSNLGFSFMKDSKVYKMLQPQVGFTWENIGSPEFDDAAGNEQSINAGVAINPELWKFQTAFAIDVRDINREVPLMSKLHFGAEAKLPWILAVRAGMAQGYYTAGLSVDLWVVKLDGAIYHQEIGTSTRTDGNQRYAVRLSFNI